ncbi:TauD/TfdA family dioxygenase [Streptomyces sp. NPDC056480]|uniref:TauD/TfdA family dioxygenase n=1 Tax=Streptomyces sp. NPDC056480 TaxID=3345833 RepID=UPI0036A9741B
MTTIFNVEDFSEIAKDVISGEDLPPSHPAVHEKFNAAMKNIPGFSRGWMEVRGALEADGYALLKVEKLNVLPLGFIRDLAILLTHQIGTPNPAGVFREAAGALIPSSAIAVDVRPRRSGNRHDPSTVDGAAPLHTDSSFSLKPERYFGLWCVNPAETGGESVLIDSREVVGELRKLSGGERCIDILSNCNLPLWMESKSMPVRILTEPGSSRAIVRFHESRIARGIIDKELPDSDPRVQALCLFMKILSSERFSRVVPLDRDEVLFIDNHRMIHGRRDFSDRNRHMLRIRMT